MSAFNSTENKRLRREARAAKPFGAKYGAAFVQTKKPNGYDTYVKTFMPIIHKNEKA